MDIRLKQKHSAIEVRAMYALIAQLRDRVNIEVRACATGVRDSRGLRASRHTRTARRYVMCGRRAFGAQYLYAFHSSLRGSKGGGVTYTKCAARAHLSAIARIAVIVCAYTKIYVTYSYVVLYIG